MLQRIASSPRRSHWAEVCFFFASFFFQIKKKEGTSGGKKTRETLWSEKKILVPPSGGEGGFRNFTARDMLDIELRGEQVRLLPERALYWPSQKTLIVADLHWGKSAHFRKHGIAVPAGAQQQDEEKLSKLIRQLDAERLIIAGDLFHSKHNNEVAQFAHWRGLHSALHIDFVIGNHDKLPAEMYADWQLAVHNEGMQTGPFYIAHDAPESCDQFCIHGHVHPAIRISRRGHNAIRLCCFCEDEERMILPAFGQFTGNHILDAAEHKHIYVIADTNVLRWK